MAKGDIASLSEKGTLPMVGDGAREKLLERRQKAIAAIQARVLSEKNEYKIRKLSKRINKICHIYDQCLAYFSEKYFFNDRVIYDLSAEEKIVLADECKRRCYKYAISNIFLLAGEFYTLFFYLMPISFLWLFGLIPWTVHFLLTFFHMPGEYENHLRIDYRFKFLSVYRRMKKIEQTANKGLL